MKRFATLIGVTMLVVAGFVMYQQVNPVGLQGSILCPWCSTPSSSSSSSMMSSLPPVCGGPPGACGGTCAGGPTWNCEYVAAARSCVCVDRPPSSAPPSSTSDYFTISCYTDGTGYCSPDPSGVYGDESDCLSAIPSICPAMSSSMPPSSSSSGVDCGDTFPSCYGECPSGQSCFNADGLCTCGISSSSSYFFSSSSETTCGDTFPTCDGECPSGQTCFDADGLCTCGTASSSSSYPYEGLSCDSDADCLPGGFCEVSGTASSGMPAPRACRAS